VLGSAGATQVFGNFTNAGVQNTWYSAALAEALSGEDLTEGTIEIDSNFSTNFAFYYGLDGTTPAGQISLLDVVMHEFGHGLGFQNFENEAAGTFLAGFQDIYSVYTYDNTQGLFWTQMTDAQRQASAHQLRQRGVHRCQRECRARALVLGPRTGFRVLSPAGIAGEYNYGTASFGAPVTLTNFNGTVVVRPGSGDRGQPDDDRGCALHQCGGVAGNIAIVDRGTCGFAVKAANAQAAGARRPDRRQQCAGQSAAGHGRQRSDGHHPGDQRDAGRRLR
jgi:hypothetical protein